MQEKMVNMSTTKNETSIYRPKQQIAKLIILGILITLLSLALFLGTYQEKDGAIIKTINDARIAFSILGMIVLIATEYILVIISLRKNTQKVYKSMHVATIVLSVIYLFFVGSGFASFQVIGNSANPWGQLIIPILCFIVQPGIIGAPMMIRIQQNQICEKQADSINTIHWFVVTFPLVGFVGWTRSFNSSYDGDDDDEYEVIIVKKK